MYVISEFRVRFRQCRKFFILIKTLLSRLPNYGEASLETVFLKSTFKIVPPGQERPSFSKEKEKK